MLGHMQEKDAATVCYYSMGPARQEAEASPIVDLD
jgi:hypothetical protein